MRSKLLLFSAGLLAALAVSVSDGASPNMSIAVDRDFVVVEQSMPMFAETITVASRTAVAPSTPNLDFAVPDIAKVSELMWSAARAGPPDEAANDHLNATTLSHYSKPGTDEEGGAGVCTGSIQNLTARHDNSSHAADPPPLIG